MAHTNASLDKAGRIFRILALNSFGTGIVIIGIMLCDGSKIDDIFGIILLVFGSSALIHWYLGAALMKNNTWVKIAGIVISSIWILGMANPLVILSFTLIENKIAWVIWSLASMFVGSVALYYLVRGWKAHKAPIEPENTRSPFDSPDYLVEIHEDSRDGDAERIPSNHPHSNPHKELIVAFGSIIIIVCIILLGTQSLGRQTEKAYADGSNAPGKIRLSNTNISLGSQNSIEAKKPTGNINAMKNLLQEQPTRLQKLAESTDTTNESPGSMESFRTQQSKLAALDKTQSTKSLPKGRLLKIGMSKIEVLNLLGEPDSTGARTLSGEKKFEMWFYGASHEYVIFINDYVDGWSM